MNKYRVEIKHVKEEIKFTPEEKKERANHYFMMITALNTVMYCIAQIGTHTLNHLNRKMFKDMHRQSKFMLDNLYPKRVESVDKDVIQDLSFNNVVAATTVFGMISRMPQHRIDEFMEKVQELAIEMNTNNAETDSE